WIGDGDHARELAVDGNENRGGSVAAQPFRFACEHISCDAELGKEFRIAQHDTLALDHADGALAGGRVKAHDALERDAALARGRDDCSSKRMLARSLDARGEA